MKILVVGFSKLKYMPYMNFYLDNIIKSENEVHLLYWNRDLKPEDTSQYQWASLHEFSCYQQDEVAKSKKIKSFMAYRRFVRKTLRENQFDFIIVLHTLPGILIFDEIKKHYSNRYILDYRDFTYENYSFYKKIIAKLVKNSAATFVSSDAYRKFLPESDKIFTSHNLLINSLDYRDIRKNKTRDISPLKIRYWGFIRHYEINLKIIEKLANDERFEFHYHGREQKTGQLLKKYCNENIVNNVYFHGEYKPDDRYEFVKDTDLLHNFYDNDVKTVNAMGNKYYDGVIFYLPQLCNKESFMGKQAEKNGVGIQLDVDSSNFADDIYNYYNGIDWRNFENSCDKNLNEIIRQYNDGIKVIEEILCGKKDD